MRNRPPQFGRIPRFADAARSMSAFRARRPKAERQLTAQLQTFSSEPKVQCQVIGTVLAN